MTAFILLASLLAACSFALLTRPVWWPRAGTAAALPSRQLLAAMAALIVAIVAGGYAWLGSPESLRLVPGVPTTPTEQVAYLIDKLAKQVQRQPDDAQAWSELAHAYVAVGRLDDALGAFKKALALHPDDADLLVDYADVLAVKNGRSLEGEPTRLIAHALQVDPKHTKALALSGMAAFKRQDFAGAVKAWDQAVQLSPPGDPMVQQLRAGLAKARQLAGLEASSPAARIAGTVSLAPALAARASPDDTVFVYARASEGPRMPLALIRKQVRDLPFEFVLDDSLAMSPTATLSSAKQVIVSARITKSGSAMPQAGDLQGSIGPVPVGANGLKIEIHESIAAPQ